MQFLKQKYLSLIRKFHNYTLQTNPRYREEETQNTNSHMTSKGNKSKATSSLSPARWLQNCLAMFLIAKITGPEVIKLFPFSTQLSTKFQLLINTKILSNKEVSCFNALRCCIYHAKNVKMPTIVGILTLMSRINFILSQVEHEKKFYNIGPGLICWWFKLFEFLLLNILDFRGPNSFKFKILPSFL